MLNIEIKARYPDLEKGARIARTLGGKYVGIDLQTDTYFNVRAGRLKLRASSLGPNLLVGYRRQDQSSAKESHYTLLEVADPPRLQSILEETLGIWKQVVKARTIYLIDNVRVHLDDVKGLGRFLEFEAVISEGRTAAEGHRQVKDLIHQFEIQPSDLLEGSYSDYLS